MRHRAAYFGVFTALALIFSYLETFIPLPFGIPGIKLGFANLLTVILLYKQDAKEALLLSVVRIILSGFLFGNLWGILYSMAGGLLSLLGVVNAAGGVSHNMGQLLVAMAVVETYRVGYYFPVLLIAGIVTGLLIGIAANEVLKRVKYI